MFSISNQEDMVECPYNKYHRIARKRLQFHLIKCRLSYPDAELCKCPFNPTHLVPEPEFTHHVSNCSDKALIAQYKYNAVPLKTEDNDRKQIEVECDEDWDDTEVEDYDPKKYSSEKNVLRPHIGDLPSNRKEFRKKERTRLGDVDSSDEEAVTEFRKKIYKDYVCKKDDQVEENGWYEDRCAASTSRSSNNRRENYKESLNEHTRDRGISHRDDNGKRSIKVEKDDGEEESFNEYSRDRGISHRDDNGKRSVKVEKDDGEEYSKRKRCEEYSLDEDPYYKTKNARSQQDSSSSRGSYLGKSRGSFRRH